MCDARLQALQSQGKLGPDLLQQATHSLDVLKASIQTQLSAVLPGTSSSAEDLSQFPLTSTITNLQHQRELCLSLQQPVKLQALTRRFFVQTLLE